MICDEFVNEVAVGSGLTDSTTACFKCEQNAVGNAKHLGGAGASSHSLTRSAGRQKSGTRSDTPNVGLSLKY